MTRFWRATAIIGLTLSLYVLSIGPVAWLMRQNRIPFWTPGFKAFYAPLLTLSLRFPKLLPVLNSYVFGVWGIHVLQLYDEQP